MAQPREVFSAGVVVFRPQREVLLVHRSRYDDWSFPKGKLDPGEHRTAAAVREVEEETGLRVRLGVPLGRQRYPLSEGRMKVVDYWVGRVVGDDDVERYVRNDEIDDVAWVPLDEAPDRLSYPYDRDTLREARAKRRRTVPLVVLRHADALARKRWTGDDAARPLLAAGERQAEALAPLLAAYDVGEVVTSDAARCVDTVAPYAAERGLAMTRSATLAEGGATAPEVARVVRGLADDLASRRAGGVLCTHRPVLPMVFEALGVEDPRLAKGALLVAHLRHGEVVATEVHGPV